ncbi:protein SERAC1 isoform X2 [Prorops nasuta]|uniref:protein SERAC1 isoform X2 n=1 Tax=Prorops nasuta TaxID=863751 RepID=UPI0034CE2B75
MYLKKFRKYVYFLKSTGACAIIMGCWLLYQVNDSLKILNSAVNSNALDAGFTQYIYIDDSKFKDSFIYDNINDLRFSTLKKQPTISKIIEKGWKIINRNLAYRLVYVAQHGDKSERARAIDSLNNLKQLEDWHYCRIAQMLDGETATALSRFPNVDLRFFLKPPDYHLKENLHDVIEMTKDLLSKLNTLCNSTHPCLSQFLSKNFKDFQKEGLIFDYDLTSIGLSAPPEVIWNTDLLENCVHAIYHHSSLEEYSQDLVKSGGLLILMKIQKILHKNIDMCILLAKILSNISLHNEYLEDIFKSGWIGILALWSQNKDIRLSAPAGRALANLDIYESEDIKYPKRIYLLYPLHKTCIVPKADIVFLHGLLGGAFITWRQRDPQAPELGSNDHKKYYEDDVLSDLAGEYPQEFMKDLMRDFNYWEWKKIGNDYEVVLDDCPEKANNEALGPYSCKGEDLNIIDETENPTSPTRCWPKDWLPIDHPYIRVLGINYETNLSMWSPFCPIESTKSTLHERSNEYATKLLMAGIGKKPIIWVCHSMGGLLVKKMLVEEWRSGDSHNICKNTRSILFYSTPHKGSRVAALRQMTQMLIWPSIEVQELREESPKLLELHQDFLKMLEDYPMEIVSFSETKPTLVSPLKLSYLFVNSDSANPGVGEFYEIPLNHLTICKPANRRSFLYQKLISIVKRHVNSEKRTEVSPIINYFLPKRIF